MNQIKVFDGMLGLIGLQVADQMPRQSVIGKFLLFLQSFLHAVFTYVGNTGCGRFFHEFDRVVLRHGDQRNRIGPPDAGGGCGNPLPYGFNIILNQA